MVWISQKTNFPLNNPINKIQILSLRLVEFYSYKGDVILDPFIGSGSTAIAALKLNRHYIGFEISPKYISLAEKRIKLIKEQLKIDNFF